MKAFKSVLTFLNQRDLTKDQVEITVQSYKDNAIPYAMDFERNVEVNGTVVYKIVLPFLDRLKKGNLVGPVLFVGCGSGRDMQFAEEKYDELKTVGVDTSAELLEIARKCGVKGGLHEVDIAKFDYGELKYSGIFCDTALTHNIRKTLETCLQSFHFHLESGGVLAIGFRNGDGGCYKTEDNYGTRYYLTHSENEARGLLVKNGFDIREVFLNEHPISGRPGFIVIIATKK